MTIKNTDLLAAMAVAWDDRTAKMLDLVAASALEQSGRESITFSLSKFRRLLEDYTIARTIISPDTWTVNMEPKIFRVTSEATSDLSGAAESETQPASQAAPTGTFDKNMRERVAETLRKFKEKGLDDPTRLGPSYAEREANVDKDMAEAVNRANGPCKNRSPHDWGAPQLEANYFVLQRCCNCNAAFIVSRPGGYTLPFYK